MIKKRGLLLVVSGPSGAGKGTICKALLEQRDVDVSISTTTRAPREGEVNGINYHFISKDKFKSEIEAGNFLEHAQVFDNFYGTPKNYVLDKLSSGQDVLLEIDIQGALQVRSRYPEGVFIFILPPSMEELKNRIIKRGTETKESLEKRFSSAYEEIKFLEKYDYFIVNDKVDKAVNKLMVIIDAERNRILDNVDDIISKFKHN